MFTQEPSSSNYSSEIQRLRRENKRLAATNSELSSENKLLQKLVESVKVGMFVKDANNVFTYVNQLFCQHLNISKDQLLFKERPRITKSLRKYINDDKKVLKSQSVIFNLIESHDEHGKAQWIETVKFPILHGAQQVSGVYGFTYDVTDTVNAQSSLQRTRTDLKKAQLVNEALRQFSYAASHDLQEPLRSVQGFLGIIKMEYGKKLDSQAEAYLNKADGSLRRMQQLIKDILDYAVINGAKYELVNVDLNEVVNDVVMNLDQAIKDHSASLIVDQLPKIAGSKSLLVHYFQNMISNALKYRSHRDPPEIRIFSLVKPQHYVIGVSDNGIGIDPAYFKEIFKPFKRLHRQGEIAGSGIGLATSKKIAEIHKGKLWVESNPGEGATFFMEVPKN